MRLNALPLTLLELFEKTLSQKKRIRYTHSMSVNANAHVRLSQDETIDYYAHKIASMFIRNPNRYNYDLLENWQILETYRVLNTALASTLVTELVKNELRVLKKDMEELPSLKTLLSKIDAGLISASVVCSGHGVWYTIDGYVDIGTVDSSVMLISGEGASLSNALATDIENGLFDPNNVAVVKKGIGEEDPSINPFPRFFNKQSGQTRVPNLCLVDDETLPKPRVIEPLTGRVLYDLQSSATKGNYFSLATVLQQVKGRLVLWAGCTGVRDEDKNKSGTYQNHRWVKKEEVVVNKRKADEGCLPAKRPKVEQQEGEEELIQPAYVFL